MCSGGGGAADDYAREQRAEQKAREARIAFGMKQINSNFDKFDDGFFNKQNQAYLDYAMPQINQQYDHAYNGLQFALARQGIGQSSVGNERVATLGGDYQLNRQAAVDKAREVTQNSRRQIEDARSGVVADLYATADPAAAAKSALSRAAYLNTPQAFSPIGQLFMNALDGLNTYRDAKQDQQDWNAAMGSAAVPGAPQGSGRNVG
jgi:hypothetical protein